MTITRVWLVFGVSEVIDYTIKPLRTLLAVYLDELKARLHKADGTVANVWNKIEIEEWEVAQ